MKKILTPGLSLIGIAIAFLGSIPQANAIPYNGNSIYKVGSGSDTAVYFSATAGSTVSVDLGLLSKISSKIVGSCGEVRITSSSLGTTPTITVDGSTVTIASLPTQLLPTCSGGTFAESRPSNFKTSTGDVVIVGKTAGSAIALDIPKSTTKQVKINACGFGTLKNSSSFTIPSTFSVNGSAVNLASLAAPTNPPFCRTTGSTSYGYVPAEWIP
jgi:hypothetical protein